MKKSFLLAIVMLVLSVSASAQYNGFAFGVKLGPAFDWAGSKTNTIHNEGTRMGFRMGLHRGAHIADPIAVDRLSGAFPEAFFRDVQQPLLFRADLADRCAEAAIRLPSVQRQRHVDGDDGAFL